MVYNRGPRSALLNSLLDAIGRSLVPYHRRLGRPPVLTKLAGPGSRSRSRSPAGRGAAPEGASAQHGVPLSVLRDLNFGGIRAVGAVAVPAGPLRGVEGVVCSPRDLDPAFIEPGGHAHADREVGRRRTRGVGDVQ